MKWISHEWSYADYIAAAFTIVTIVYIAYSVFGQGNYLEVRVGTCTGDGPLY